MGSLTIENMTRIALEYEYILWDVDGTLLDSMALWKNLASRYIRSRGAEPPEDLDRLVSFMTMEEAAAYMQKNILPDDTAENLLAGVKDMLRDAYCHELPEKETGAHILRQAGEAGIRMAVLTTGNEELAGAALTRLGLRGYLERILTADELKMDKHSPAIYERAMELLGFEPAETLICEDAVYAVRSASAAGAHVMAFRDRANEPYWEEICRLADHAEA